jgi:hypothetical protein
LDWIRVDGQDRVLVLDEIAEVRVSSSPTGVSSDSGSLRDLEDFSDLLQRHAELFGELFRVGSRPISLSIWRLVRTIC